MPGSESPLISLRDVNVHLNGRLALARISWDLHAGEHWAFSGPNGSGKSTLLRVMRGLQWIDPDGGQRVYRFDGRPRGAFSARSNIGYVSPEQHEYYARLALPVPGRTIVASGLDDTLYVHRPVGGADAHAVDDIIGRLGLEKAAAQRTDRLSFGQLRRLLIARALVRRPRVLVLDEYTNGLDASARAGMLDLLATLAPDVQLILASHRADDFIAAVTHHGRLQNGRIIERGAGRPPQHPNGAPSARPAAQSALAGEALVAIEAADVYRSGTRVLHGVTWSIRPGEHTAVSGENGSGKSTFAAVVAGTLAPAYGASIVRRGERGPFDVWRIKATVAHVSEEWQIAFDVNHTVDEVILSGFAASVGLFHEPDDAQRARAATVIAQLGLGALRERRFMQLSFGERRKALIARALVRPPELLILDEVWNGLDAPFRARFEALLADLRAGGTTLLLIAHHADDVPASIVRHQRIAGGTVADA